LKIIFLDIDGVINPWMSEKDSSGRFGQRDLENFKIILVTVLEASVVITSTWRNHYTLSEIKEFFNEVGINPNRILDVTHDLRCDEGMIQHYPGRNEEIQAWIDLHPEVGKFAVIDDVEREQIE
jgi:hypothetical protein